MISRRPFFLLVPFALLSLCSPPVQAKPDAQASVAAIYAARDTAFRSKNVAGALAGYSPTVLIYDADGNPSSGTAGPREDLTKLFGSGIPWSSPLTTLEEVEELDVTF